jgi:hypothetical protein
LKIDSQFTKTRTFGQALKQRGEKTHDLPRLDGVATKKILILQR